MKADSKTFTVDPKAARDAVTKHLKRLNASTNMVQYTAQLHERDMVELLAEFAVTDTLPASLRRQCAIDVITFARGAVKAWLHNGEDIDPVALGGAGLGPIVTIGDEIEAARQTADLHKELDRLTSANVHPRDWPAAVREVAGDMIAYYESDEAFTPKGA